MNDEIRAAVRAEIKRQGLDITTAAARLGKPRQQISRLLSDNAKRGEVSADWAALLDLLGLELVVRKKKD